MEEMVIDSELMEDLPDSSPVDGGQCVALVVHLLKLQYPDAPADKFHHSNWRKGVKVMSKGTVGDIKPGTAVATFDPLANGGEGGYPNCDTGNHAGIFLKFAGDGFKILEQNVSDTITDDRTVHFRNTNVNGRFPSCRDLYFSSKIKHKQWFFPSIETLARTYIEFAPTNDADWYYVIKIDGI
jgi:hypothetical protein